MFSGVQCCPTQDEPEDEQAGSGHNAGECKSPCSMPNVSPWPRCGSFSTPAAISASPAPAASRFMAFSRAPLRAQKYLELSKKDKGIVRRYLVKISGLRKAQITRLIARWRERGVIEPRASRRHRFPHRYTPADIQLLAETDAAHEGLSAPAVRRILQREIQGPSPGRIRTTWPRSRPLISNNLRRTRAYREHHVHHTKTRRLGGEHRRAPQAPARAASPATCGSTRCTRATPAPARGSTTSTPSTRSRNGRWWAAAKPSPRLIYCQF